MLAPILPRPIIPICIFRPLPSMRTPYGLARCRLHDCSNSCLSCGHILIQAIVNHPLHTGSDAPGHSRKCWAI